MTALRSDHPFGDDPFAPRRPSCTPGSRLADCPEHAGIGDFYRGSPWLMELHPGVAPPRVAAPAPAAGKAPAAVEPELRPVEKFTRVAPVEKHAPKAKVPTREPDTQNQHMKCIRKLHTLSHAEFRVAVELHYVAYINGGKAVCARGYIAKATGVTNSNRVTRRLVEVGLFRRLDNGKGGRGGGNSAAYVPTVPEWWK